MIATAENVDAKWSEKKMEESDALRTVECLRGRLIAERTVSKISKDEADQLANKLIELERKVKEEIKSRNKVEKKLRFLMKKLENLNISYSCSDQECCSDNNSILEEDMSDGHKTQIAESQLMTPTTVSQTSEISSLSTISSFASIKDRNLETEFQTKDFSSSPTSSMGSKIKERRVSEDDDSMALVLVDLSEESSKVDEESSSTINYVSGNVKDVLDALKHAREKIQSSMEKKRIMIKVGSQLGKQ